MKLEPVILFRPDQDNQIELSAAERFWKVVTQRSDIPANSLVVPRYSALPYFKELEYDVTKLGSRLINRYEQFQWIANFEYYDLLKDYTFPTYFDQTKLPDRPMVVKGRTNSRKHQWNTQCYASSREAAIRIACDLKQDALIGTQDIIFREYQPLETFEELINGLPVTNEWRFFFYKTYSLNHGYYWSNAEHPEKAKIDHNAYDLVHEIAKLVAPYNNFFVIDIAKKANGDWIMVELNAGEMSGLAMCTPQIMYILFKEAIEREDILNQNRLHCDM